MTHLYIFIHRLPVLTIELKYSIYNAQDHIRKNKKELFRVVISQNFLILRIFSKFFSMVCYTFIITFFLA